MKQIVAVVALALLAAQMPAAQERTDAGGRGPRPTAHPALPSEISQYWYVPASRPPVSGSVANFVRAARLVRSGQFAAALPLVNAEEIARTPLGGYGFYVKALALQGLERRADADAAFAVAASAGTHGYLAEAVPLQRAELAIAAGDGARALSLVDALKDRKVTAPQRVLLTKARAYERAGNRAAAVTAYGSVYYDHPLTAEASDAQSGLERLQTADLVPSDRFKRELARAEQLFAARRWAQARAAFVTLTRAAQGDESELVALRVAECDYYLGRHAAARNALVPYLDEKPLQAEARFFHLTATREAGDHATYVRLARRLAADFPDSAWTEETLNNLASHHIKVNEDDQADLVFRDLYKRFPKSRHAERAAWKVGWRAYRAGNVAETAQLFEEAAVAYPRADNRPAWLYWAARARDQMNDVVAANHRYRLAVTDYGSTYYGRRATAILTARREPIALETVTATTATAATIPTDAIIRQLNALGLYDEALREVQYAQQVWGDSPQLQATTAWIRHHQGLSLSGIERFNALRGAINTMRRAYPQFMTVHGEQLPPEILRIIFPLDFWPMIQRGSTQLGLDPFLIAALMAQESTFTPEIKSSANAVGLMQLLPSTARRYARKVGMTRFTTASLENPETNMRLGMTYFKELSDRFGGAHFALASYNAGENRVAQWRAEKPDLPQDEFIDDIPFPETQNYVKRILGTAEDYRRLYGGGLLDPNYSLSAEARAEGAAPAAKPAATSTPAKKPAVKKAAPKKAPAKKAPARRRPRRR